ncbi:MAG TPA: hypothetical protein VGT04_16610 [Acidobacteriaceae bacterium]|nr:hypothetical protein [Acidobacteriaceae bacterium]
MKIAINRWALACVCIAVVSASAAFAQQSSGSDQYSGVSHPPSDDTIVATPDATPPPPPPAAVQTKPSAAVTATAPPATRATQNYGAVVTTGPTDSGTTHLKYDNTDYGIVTVPFQPTQATPQTFGSTAVLHTRDNTPDGIVTQGTTDSANQLPEGAMIRVQINNDFSTKYTTVDSPFEGRVVLNVVQDGSVVIPAGSTLRGHVTQVSQGHHVGFGPAATIRLRPDVVILPDGTAYHLDAEVIESDASGTRVGREGGIKPTAHVLKKTVEYGAGAGGGAIVGAELGGPVGALAGSLVGASVVTTHLLEQQPQAVVIPAGSQIVFSLTQPLNLTPTRN